MTFPFVAVATIMLSGYISDNEGSSPLSLMLRDPMPTNDNRGGKEEESEPPGNNETRCSYDLHRKSENRHLFGRTQRILGPDLQLWLHNSGKEA